MTGANAVLHDLSVWARGNLLVIVLLVLGAILLTRFAVWARDRFMARVDGAPHIELTTRGLDPSASRIEQIDRRRIA